MLTRAVLATSVLFVGGGCHPPVGECVDDRIERGQPYVLTLVGPLEVEGEAFEDLPPCPIDDLEAGMEYNIVLDEMDSDGSCRYLKCPSSLPTPPASPGSERVTTWGIGSWQIVCQNTSEFVSLSSDCTVQRFVTMFFTGDELRLQRRLSIGDGSSCESLPEEFPEVCTDLWTATLRPGE